MTDISADRVERAAKAIWAEMHPYTPDFSTRPGEGGPSKRERERALNLARAALTADSKGEADAIAAAEARGRIAGLEAAKGAIINAMRFSDGVRDNVAYTGGFNDAKIGALAAIDARLAELTATKDEGR